MFYFYELTSIHKSELSIIPLIVSGPKAWAQMNSKILAFHSSLRATSVIAICYKHLQTFLLVIMELCTVFTALFLYAHAKRGSNVTAAADGNTVHAIGSPDLSHTRIAEVNIIAAIKSFCHLYAATGLKKRQGV